MHHVWADLPKSLSSIASSAGGPLAFQPGMKQLNVIIYAMNALAVPMLPSLSYLLLMADVGRWSHNSGTSLGEELHEH